MKRTLQIALVMGALLLPLDAIAQPYWAQNPVQCGTHEEIINITKRFGEIPFLVLNEGLSMNNTGEYVRTRLVVAHNQETGSWILIEFPMGQSIACILSSGNSIQKLLDIGSST